MQETAPNTTRSENTQKKLIDAARSLFLEHGFAETGTPQIVKKAGVTRGALYHHYDDKRGLFEAVVRAEAHRVAQDIDNGTKATTSPKAALMHGATVYFSAMAAPGRTQLLLIEGPAALGPAKMRAIDLETGGLSLRDGLAAALGADRDETHLAALADLISAMFDRAVLAQLQGAEIAPYVDAIEKTLSALLARA